jgi:hypothetical protein
VIEHDDRQCLQPSLLSRCSSIHRLTFASNIEKLVLDKLGKKRPGRESNPQPSASEADTLPLRHLAIEEALIKDNMMRTNIAVLNQLPK